MPTSNTTPASTEPRKRITETLRSHDICLPDRVAIDGKVNKTRGENSLKVDAMANPEHLKLFDGTSSLITWWHDSGRDRQPLDLSSARLRGPQFPQEVLASYAELPPKTGRPYNQFFNALRRTLFVRASLRDSTLADTTFYNLNLTGAQFGGAKVLGAVFKNCNLNDTDFDRAWLDGVIFADCDLSKARNLETVKSFGPIHLDALTLMRSKSIPDSFLREAGVPADLITYLPSLRGKTSPIQFYSCFISYSHKDEEFCKRLHSRMQQEKMQVWYAPEELAIGDIIHEAIDQAIRVHEKLLLVLSTNSARSSWVEQEIYHALDREQHEGKRVLFPIRLVPHESLEDWRLPPFKGKDMARIVRERLSGDFSNWKDHDSFEAAFARLLRDLETDPVGVSG